MGSREIQADASESRAKDLLWTVISDEMQGGGKSIHFPVFTQIGIRDIQKTFSWNNEFNQFFYIGRISYAQYCSETYSV